MGIPIIFAMREAIENFRTARIYLFVAIGTITVSLFLFGIFLLGTVNLQNAISSVEEKVEIVAFLRDGLSSSQILEIEDTIKKIGGIQNVKYVTREEALEKLRQDLAGKSDLLEALETNPLPCSFQIKLKKGYRDPERISEIAGQIDGIIDVEEVDYGREWVVRLYKIIRILLWIDACLFLVVLLSSGFVIANTIRLAVFARREAIEIMRLVGATPGFIRAPFLIEGMLEGMLGGILGAILLFFSYRMLISKIPGLIFLTIGYFLLPIALGIFLGFLGSFVAVQKLLKTSYTYA